MFAWRKEVSTATGSGRRLPFWFGAVLCIAATFVAPTVARADLNTNYAPGPDARNFGDSDGGWTGAEDYSGLCIAGVTCVDVDDNFVATGGVAGAGDGFIRTSEGGLLSLGIAATSTGVWSSPQFTYSGAEGAVPDTLRFRIVRRSDIDDFLNVLGTSATYRIDLVDHSGGSNVNLSPTQTLAGPNAWTPIAAIDVDPSDLTVGHDYSIRIVNEFEAPVALLPGGQVDYDNVILRAHTDTPPLNTSIAGPSGSIQDPTPTYTFSSPDPAATFECSLDDAPFTACESPYTTEPLDHGRHDLRVRAVDAGGKVDRTPAKRAVWVAVTTRMFGPAGSINNRTPTYRFNSPDASATFECSFDDGPFTACESPYTTDPLSNGRHQLLVRAVVDGKVDTSPARRVVWIPKSAPPA